MRESSKSLKCACITTPITHNNSSVLWFELHAPADNSYCILPYRWLRQQYVAERPSQAETSRTSGLEPDMYCTVLYLCRCPQTFQESSPLQWIFQEGRPGERGFSKTVSAASCRGTRSACDKVATTGQERHDPAAETRLECRPFAHHRSPSGGSYAAGLKAQLTSLSQLRMMP